jgi:uncharacterized protein
MYRRFALLGTLLVIVPIYSNAAPSQLRPALPLDTALDQRLSGLSAMEIAYRDGIAAYEENDYVAAIKLLQAPAEQGHAEAQFTLGVMYVTGRGAAKDIDTAAVWWQRAAEQRHAPSLYNLGWLHAQGNGVDQDYAKARHYWHEAAVSGDAAAQFQLGVLAATGEGGPRNYQEAVRWWRLAAAQGYQQALDGLEILKKHGVATD